MRNTLDFKCAQMISELIILSVQGLEKVWLFQGVRNCNSEVDRYLSSPNTK